MPDSPPPDVCSKCKMPKQKQASGILTQWVFVCRCSLHETETGEPPGSIEFCRKCTKRIASEKRQGTLTQWIFRSDLCSCENPLPEMILQRAAKDNTAEPSSLPFHEGDELADETQPLSDAGGPSMRQHRALTVASLFLGGLVLITTCLCLAKINSGASGISEEKRLKKTAAIQSRRNKQMNEGLENFDLTFGLSEKPWVLGKAMLGADAWKSGPKTTDEDFKLLLRERDLPALDISFSNTISGVGFKYLANKPIELVQLKSDALTDEGLACIAKIRTIRSLRISLAKKITNAGLRQLGKLQNLEHLELIVMPLPDGALQTMSTFHKLQAVSLYQSHPLTTTGLSALREGLPDLWFLDISGTGLDGQVVPVAARMSSLKELRMADLDLSGAPLYLLSNLKLIRLDLS